VCVYKRKKIDFKSRDPNIKQKCYDTETGSDSSTHQNFGPTKGTLPGFPLHITS
jgi:hypothetical protein